MAELKVEAPLAKFEIEDEWVDFQSSTSMDADVDPNSNPATMRKCFGDNAETACSPNASAATTKTHVVLPDNYGAGFGVDNFAEDETSTSNFGGSLEDLVNTFDDKITKCFFNYQESVEKFAPVQVRTQEEIMSECQMWWTITGNFGNILPIDWSKSYARKLHIPALNLNEKQREQDLSLDDDDDDEDVAKDLDLHSLIISSLQQEPMFTAEEVLEEIDEIMQETPPSEESPDGEEGDEDEAVAANKRPHTLELKGRAAVDTPLYEEKLRSLTASQLNELYVELELMIKELSETLIRQLALRDENEYEKELKNTFISLLLSVQNKRRQYNLDKKKKSKMSSGPNGVELKYLTTVIPYHKGNGPTSIHTLQVLIKILQAINEDSPTVPTLLTDYILKVLCPTT